MFIQKDRLFNNVRKRKIKFNKNKKKKNLTIYHLIQMVDLKINPKINLLLNLNKFRKILIIYQYKNKMIIKV